MDCYCWCLHARCNVRTVADVKEYNPSFMVKEDLRIALTFFCREVGARYKILIATEMII